MPGRRKEAGIAPACCEEIAGGLGGSSSLLAERRQSGHQRRHAASKPAVRQHVEGRIIPGQAEAQVTAVQAGLGIAQLATWVVGTAIAPRQSGDRSSGPGDPGFASAYRVAAQPGAFGQGAGGGGAFRKDSGHWRRDREVIVLHCLLGPVHIQSVRCVAPRRRAGKARVRAGGGATSPDVQRGQRAFWRQPSGRGRQASPAVVAAPCRGTTTARRRA